MGLLGWFTRNARKAATPVEVEAATGASVRSSRARRRRNYDGALATRLTGDWTTTSLTIDEYIRRHVTALRARSRDLYRNNDYGRRFVHLVRANVIGRSGIQFQARIKDPDGKPDVLANQSVEAAWKDWGSPQHCHMPGRASWVELQRMIAGNLALDGEVIVRLWKTEATPPYHFALDLIDPDLLDVERNEELRDGSYIRLGIEYNTRRRPIAYHLLEHSPLDTLYGYRTGAKHVRVPAAEIVHAFIPELVGQSRGVPWMASAMLRMKMLGGYEDASLTAARMGAANMGFIETPDGEPVAADGEDEHGNPQIEAEPGMFWTLEPGQKVNTWSAEYPKGEFQAFVKTCLRGIASGLGISYNIFANDLEGVNYSSIRQGVLDEREIWMGYQDYLVDAVCRVIFERWLSLQLDLGTLTVPTRNGPATLNPALFDKYRRCDWQPKRWPWVDPLKDMQANAIARDRGWVSDSQIIRESGREPEEVWAEIASDEARKQEYGVPPPPEEPPKQPDPVMTEEDEEPAEEEEPVEQEA